MNFRLIFKKIDLSLKITEKCSKLYLITENIQSPLEIYQKNCLFWNRSSTNNMASPKNITKKCQGSAKSHKIFPDKFYVLKILKLP